MRYLAALESRHYVERINGNAGDRLGVAFRAQRPNLHQCLVEVARPLFLELSEELEETANLGILDGSQIVHAVVVEFPHMMRLAARVGELGFIHSTALSKALTAPLPEARVRAILEVSGLPKLTESTIVDPEAFLEELQRTRDRGFCIDEAKNQSAGRCVGVVIPDIPILAGVSISAPADRLPIEAVETIARRLQAVAAAISEQVHRVSDSL